FAPANFNGGAFDGSDLQRAMRDPRYIRNAFQQPQNQTYVVYQPQPFYGTQYSPVLGLNGYRGSYGGFGYGFGYGCNGWNNGCGDSNIIVVNNGSGFTGNTGGGRTFVPTPNTNGQAILAISSW